MSGGPGEGGGGVEGGAVGGDGMTVRVGSGRERGGTAVDAGEEGRAVGGDGQRSGQRAGVGEDDSEAGEDELEVLNREDPAGDGGAGGEIERGGADGDAGLFQA